MRIGLRHEQLRALVWALAAAGNEAWSGTPPAPIGMQADEVARRADRVLDEFDARWKHHRDDLTVTVPAGSAYAAKEVKG